MSSGSACSGGGEAPRPRGVESIKTLWGNWTLIFTRTALRPGWHRVSGSFYSRLLGYPQSFDALPPVLLPQAAQAYGHS
jgi:hypothetical protein